MDNTAEMDVYKVVSRNYKKYGKGGYTSVYRSAMDHLLPASFSLSYRLHRKTYPRKGKIMAFTSLLRAQDFASNLQVTYRRIFSLEFLVMKCKAQAIVPLLGTATYSANLRQGNHIGDVRPMLKEDLNGFWDNPNIDTFRRYANIGTIYCDWLNPQEIID